MITFASYLPWIQPYCPDVPDVIATDAVRNAAIEFCRESLWLQEELAAITVVADQNDYTLTPTADNVEIVQVRFVSFNGFPLRAASEQVLDSLYGLDWRQQTGQPVFYTDVYDQTLRLVPMPDDNVTGVVNPTAAVMPLRTAVDADPNLFNRWLEEICFGARARLHEMAGQGFTNFRAAQACAARFKAGIARARADRNSSETGGDLRVVPRRFY